jgi:hypothetical protein
MLTAVGTLCALSNGRIELGQLNLISLENSFGQQKYSTVFVFALGAFNL